MRNETELYELKNLLEFSKIYNHEIFSIYNSIDYIMESLDEQSKIKLKDAFDNIANNCYSMIKNTSNMNLYLKLKNGMIENITNETLCIQKELMEIVQASNKILTRDIISLNNRTQSLIFLDINSEWLSVIILNLLNNSLNSSKEDPKINIYIDKVEEFCTITVQDNGVGISKEMLENVKSEFYSYNIESNTKTTAGVGLYIVKELIHLVNGEFSISSTLNVGTSVTFKIPINSDYSSSKSKLQNNTVVSDMYYNNMSDLYAFLKG